MSVPDSTGKLLQDLIAPDLKALQVQVSSLEKRVDDRFNALEKTVDTRFAAQEKSMDARFAAQEKTMDARFAAQSVALSALNNKIDSRFLVMNEKLDAQREGLQADIRILTANLGLMVNTLQEIGTRLRHMESDRERERYAAARNPPGAPPSAAA